MPAEGIVAHQFEDAAQQREAATLGMWVFLATEVLFFGGMFLGYTVYRIAYPQIFHIASNHTLLLAGTINTAILLISSFTMALGVRAAHERREAATAVLLAVTAALGCVFLVIKGFEYRHEIHEGLFPGSGFRMPDGDAHLGRLFFYFYFLMTGVHALHVAIGVVFLGGAAMRLVLTLRSARLTTSVELLGLYWLFVDLVWVFLFPLIYLPGRAS
jgi:cytochrome c oxidase subunit 3